MPTLALFEETSLLQTAPLLESSYFYPTAVSLREQVLLLGGLDTFLFGTPHSSIVVADARRADAVTEIAPFLNAKGRAKKEEDFEDEDDDEDEDDFEDDDEDEDDDDDYDEEDLAGLGEFDSDEDEDDEIDDEEDIEFEDFDEEDFDLDDEDDDF